MGLASEAIVLRTPGGPETLVLEAIDVAVPGPGQLLIRQSAASVNFHDVYVRSGSYQTLPLPGIPGLEAVGRVEALGEGVTQFAVGDRVAYISRNYGAYARLRVIDEVLAVPVPEGIDDGVATAWFLKGLTAQALVDDVEPVHPGSVVLAQAAGGGVGQLVARMAKLRGATVIGTAGSPEKIEIARSAGCDHVIAYREADVAAAVIELTGGRGVRCRRQGHFRRLAGGARAQGPSGALWTGLGCYPAVRSVAAGGQIGQSVAPVPVALYPAARKAAVGFGQPFCGDCGRAIATDFGRAVPAG